MSALLFSLTEQHCEHFELFLESKVSCGIFFPSEWVFFVSLTSNECNKVKVIFVPAFANLGITTNVYVLVIV